MPEYCVPFAIHLLSLRRETPSAGGIVVGMPGATQLAASESSDEDGFVLDDSAHQKILRKRLKWLFEPLVLSLGDSADNISFLLRMTEIIGSQFQPRDAHAHTGNEMVLSNYDDSSATSQLQRSGEGANVALRTAKMKTTCAAARDVLLTFVKKDVNLTPYPGQIEVPTSVFEKLALSFPKAANEDADSGTPTTIRSARNNTDTAAHRGSRMGESFDGGSPRFGGEVFQPYNSLETEGSRLNG